MPCPVQTQRERDRWEGKLEGATLSRFVAIKTYEIFVYYRDPNDTWGVAALARPLYCATPLQTYTLESASSVADDRHESSTSGVSKVSTSHNERRLKASLPIEYHKYVYNTLNNPRNVYACMYVCMYIV